MNNQKDAEWSPDHLGGELETPRMLRRRPAEAMALESGGKSTGKKRKTEASLGVASCRSFVLPTTNRSCTTMLQHLKRKLAGASFDANLSMRVKHAALVLQKEYLDEKSKLKNSEHDASAPRIRDRVCKLLGISQHTYYHIMKGTTTDAVYESGGRGNKEDRETRIPYHKPRLMVAVREFVRSKRMNRERVTGQQVMEWMEEKKILSIPREEDGGYTVKGWRTALRAVQRWLLVHGYKRGKKSGSLAMKAAIQAQRDLYLKEFFDNRKLPVEEQKRECYLDESYIHQHYHKRNDSLLDPLDEELQEDKQPEKGARYCFLAALQGPKPTAFQSTGNREEDKKLLDALAIPERGSVMKETVWTFSPQKKEDSTGDYHKVFDGNNFLQWWKEQLLPALGEEKHIIIMDNASYHCVLPPSVPKLNAKKQVLVEYLQSKGIEFSPEETLVVIRQRVKLAKAMEKPMTVLLAEEAGHKVLFTPPYHSDLQPIELLWAKLKGNIGRKYSKDTTMTVLKQRLDEEFNKSVTWHQSVEGFIAKAAEIGQRFLQDAEQEDNEGTEEEQEPLEVYDDQVEASQELLEGLGVNPRALEMDYEDEQA